MQTNRPSGELDRSTGRRVAPRCGARSGFALVAVLLVLMALFLLTAPFLFTTTSSERSSIARAERAQATLALDTAARHARAQLSRSHGSLDPTPFHDSEEELWVDSDVPGDIYDAQDPTGAQWDLESGDEAGRIDLNSAPGQVFANLFGAAPGLAADLAPDDLSARLTSTAGLEPSGVVWLGPELVAYQSIEGNELQGLERGLGVQLTAEGEPEPCGPSPATAHTLGATAVDQRAEAIPTWRIGAGDGRFRPLDGLEQTAEAQEFVLAGAFAPDDLVALAAATTVHAHVGAGPRWQQGTRLTAPVDGEGGNSCRLSVDDGRWFNPGTTVRIEQGDFSEVALVRYVGRGVIGLDRALSGTYDAYRAIVRPLARRPVNLNTASPEVLRALFENLRLAGSRSFLTAREASQLIEVVVVSRPFTGFEDFLRRVVLPAAGLDELPEDAPVVPEIFERGEEATFAAESTQSFLDREDALALYKNGLNANDAELNFSTMPFAFTSRDVHRLQLRASVAARSGVSRGDAVREEVLLAAPQESLLAAWARQEDFDLAGRLHRTMPGWNTGPVNTVRPDIVYRSWHPSEARAHLGPNDSQPWDADAVTDDQRDGTFPDRGLEDAWATLRPARTDEVGVRRGRVLHFDHEERSSDGRYLPDGVIQREPSDPLLGWASADGLARGLQFETWLNPRSLEDGATFLDVGGVFPDADRFTLLFEEGDLVFRAFDGAGDHPDTVFDEAAELRYAFGAENGPGIQPDTWVHVALEATGTKPTQMQMLIDGQAWARTPGLTRLVGSVSPESSTIQVESTEGFPDTCVLRIGEELLEAVRVGPSSFQVSAETEGARAGFGGRIAREVFTGVDPGLNTGAVKDTAHPPGSAVEHYGYTIPLSSNVPSGGGTLTSGLGPFAVSRVVGISQGGVQSERQMEPIIVRSPAGFSFTIGYGLDGVGNDVDALVLDSADPNGNAEYMEAFSQTGGYAAIVARSLSFRVTDPATGQSTNELMDINGSPMGGVEVVRYSGWRGNQLFLQRRGDAVSELANLGNVPNDSSIGGRRAFVAYWEDGVTIQQDQETRSPNEILSWQLMVVPISIPVTGADQNTFLQGTPQVSQFAQITRLGEESHLTEWVRYDEVVQGHLVRDEPNALLALQRAVLGGQISGAAEGTLPNGDGDGDGGDTTGGDPTGGTGGTGTAGLLQTGMLGAGPAVTASTPAPRASSAPVAGAFWDYRIGQPTDLELPVTRAVSTQFQFRGVLGTGSQTHGASNPVLPVWQVPDRDLSAGRVGRLDAIYFISDDLTDPGTPARIHFAHRPREFTAVGYDDGEDLLGAVAGEEFTLFHTGVILGTAYVALEEPLPIPYAAGSSNPDAALLPIADPRIYTRIVKFPSGERPRIVANASLGGPAIPGAPGTIPSATIDEVAFGNPLFGSAELGEGGIGGQLVLERPFLDGELVMEIFENTLRTPVGNVIVEGDLLSSLPEGGGLLRVGKELVVFEGYEIESDLIQVPEAGRGVLGTQVDGHAIGEGVSLVEGIRATTLTQGVGAGDAILPVNSTLGFPARGTVLVGQELIHYDWIYGDVLAMPERSRVAGANDGEGAGLWRGRFGTDTLAHPAGTPVILFPTRYWDRWADRAEAPEMHFLQLGLDAPSAYWRRLFFEVEESALAGPRLGVLQRTDPDLPWDATPDERPELKVIWDADTSSDGVAIERQSDAIDWRVFVRYEPGSFDALTGTRSGWKAAPRLKLLGAEYLSPWMLLEQVQR